MPIEDEKEPHPGTTCLDPRFQDGWRLFNKQEWYPCHDAFESLWFETSGPDRGILQGLLQIAVAHLHLERGNRQGAIMLLGEGLGRLRRAGDEALGIDLSTLRHTVRQRLEALQLGGDPAEFPLPTLASPVNLMG